MKSLVFAVVAASVLSAPLVSVAQEQSNPPLTRAEVKADLIRLEQAGYRPSTNDPYYPSDLQAAEQRVAREQGEALATAETSGYGGTEGSVQSGSSAGSRPMNVDRVHSLYFGH